MMVHRLRKILRPANIQWMTKRPSHSGKNRYSHSPGGYPYAVIAVMQIRWRHEGPRARYRCILAGCFHERISGTLMGSDKAVHHTDRDLKLSNWSWRRATFPWSSFLCFSLFSRAIFWHSSSCWNLAILLAPVSYSPLYFFISACASSSAFACAFFIEYVGEEVSQAPVVYLQPDSKHGSEKISTDLHLGTAQCDIWKSTPTKIEDLFRDCSQSVTWCTPSRFTPDELILKLLNFQVQVSVLKSCKKCQNVLLWAAKVQPLHPTVEERV